MAGKNAILNSSFEFGDNWQHAVAAAVPDNWFLAASAGGLGTLAPRIDYRNPQHGILSARIQDIAVIPNAGFVTAGQDSIAVMAGTGSPCVLSCWVEGYTGELDFNLTIRYHDAAHANVGGAQVANFTNAQLAALGAASGPVRVSVTGNVPAGAHHAIIYAGVIKNSAGSTSAPGQSDITIDRLQYESGSTPTAYAHADGYQGGGGGAGPKDMSFVYASGEYLLTSPSPLTGLKMNDHNAGANDGYDLIVEKCIGLFDMPDIKVSGDYEDNAYHGGIAGVEHFAARTITMDVILRANSEYLYNKKLAAIKRALASTSVDRKLWFKRVGMEGLSKKFANVRVRRMGGFDSTYDSAKGLGKGSIQLVAHDPALYDAISIRAAAAPGAGVVAPTAFAGWSAVAVPGIFRTYPIVTITGPVTNPHIYRTYGGTISAEESYTGDFILATTIPAGQSVVVNFKDRTVVHSSGADWRQYISDSSKWWSVSPLPGATVSIGVSANPNVTGFSAVLEWWTAWL